MPNQILSLLIAMFIGAAPAAPGPAAVSSPRVARLEIRLTTSAPVTVVRLSPGTVLADRVVSSSGGLQVESGPAGWTIRSGPTGSTLRFRAVFEEPTQAASLRLRLRVAGAGNARLHVINTSAAPFDVSVLSVSSSSSDRSVLLRRAQLFGRSEPAAASPDRRRLVLAAYYPWFGSYNRAKLFDRPADPRSTRDAAGVLAMTRQAAAAGIDGFVVSWAGAQRNGAGLDLVLDAAERSGMLATVYLETLAANAEGTPASPAQPAVVLAWLKEALRRAPSPAFLRSGGVPVVFVYQMRALKPWDWAWMLQQLRAEGKAVRLVGDAGMNSYGANEWGFHQYSPNNYDPDPLRAWNRRSAAEARLLAEGAPKLFVATVSPGYDDRRARGSAGTFVPRGAAGERYTATWDAALASSPDWILVTSWNEWFEGTTVEPGIATGDLAFRQTASYAARFKG